MTTPDRAAAPAPLAERLAGGVSLISVLIREHLNCAAQLGKDGDPDARAHRDAAESLGAVLAALDGREAWNEAIEAAASLCERRADGHKSGLSGLHKDAYAREGKWCATAIRALARPQPTEEAK